MTYSLLIDQIKQHLVSIKLNQTIFILLTIEFSEIIFS